MTQPQDLNRLISKLDELELHVIEILDSRDSDLSKSQSTPPPPTIPTRSAIDISRPISQNSQEPKRQDAASDDFMSRIRRMLGL